MKEAADAGVQNFAIDRYECIGFIGLCLARGVLKGKGEPLRSFWSESTGRSLFGKNNE